MRKMIAPLLLILSASCASTSLHSSSATNPAASSAPPARSARSARADYYILLSSPGQLREMGLGNISGLHVNGNMNGQGFSPVSQVEGNGKFCPDGKDWLDLTTLTVHTAADGHPPAAPYLRGCAVSKGFEPASRDVVLQ
jgi:hypothetical protein